MSCSHLNHQVLQQEQLTDTIAQFFLGKHKLKVDFYKPHHSMLSSASCPTMPVSTDSSMLTPSTKSRYVSTSITTAEASSLNDKTYSSDQPDTLDKMTSTTEYQSAGCHSVGQLSSTGPMGL